MRWFLGVEKSDLRECLARLVCDSLSHLVCRDPGWVVCIEVCDHLALCCSSTDLADVQAPTVWSAVLIVELEGPPDQVDLNSKRF